MWPYLSLLLRIRSTFSKIYTETKCSDRTFPCLDPSVKNDTDYRVLYIVISAMANSIGTPGALVAGLQEGAICFHRTKHYCPATPSDSSHLLKDDFIQTNEVSY